MEEVLTPQEVADFLKVDLETVYRYIRSGKLIASRLGKKYRIPKRNVDLFLLSTSTGQGAREALFERVAEIATRRERSPQEVERDVEEAIRAVRGQR